MGISGCYQAHGLYVSRFASAIYSYSFPHSYTVVLTLDTILYIFLTLSGSSYITEFFMLKEKERWPLLEGSKSYAPQVILFSYLTPWADVPISRKLHSSGGVLPTSTTERLSSGAGLQARERMCSRVKSSACIPCICSGKFEERRSETDRSIVLDGRTPRPVQFFSGLGCEVSISNHLGMPNFCQPQLLIPFLLL